MGNDIAPYLGDQQSPGGYTFVHNEACTSEGRIIKIEVYALDADPSSWQFGVFTKSGLAFTDKSYKQDFALVAGINTFEEVTDYPANTFRVTLNDYIGWYNPEGSSMSGNSSDNTAKGLYFIAGDDVGDSDAGTFDSTYATSGIQPALRVYIEADAIEEDTPNVVGAGITGATF
jgi:hypothetical protein